MGGRRGVDPPVKLPNNLLKQTATSLSVSQGILPSRPPLLSYFVRRRRRIMGDAEEMLLSAAISVKLPDDKDAAGKVVEQIACLLQAAVNKMAATTGGCRSTGTVKLHYLGQESENAAKCSSCGQWTSDVDKPAPIDGIRLGRKTGEKFTCFPCEDMKDDRANSSRLQQPGISCAEPGAVAAAWQRELANRAGCYYAKLRCPECIYGRLAFAIRRDEQTCYLLCVECGGNYDEPPKSSAYDMPQDELSHSPRWATRAEIEAKGFEFVTW
jgi:hypothetical protein